jgi:hypothetical protein
METQDKPLDAEVIPQAEPPKAEPPLPKTNAVVRHGVGVLFASVAEVWSVADNLRKGGAGPKGATTASIAASIIKGQSLGLDPVTAMSFVTIVNGRASLMGDLALGLLRQSGLINPKLGGAWVEEWTGEGEDRRCSITATRHDTGETMTRSFSVAEARTAGLIGKTAIWHGFLDRMLRYRALGFVARDLFSDVLLGLYITEELQDASAFAPKGSLAAHVTPQEAAAPEGDPFFVSEPQKALAAPVAPEATLDLTAGPAADAEPITVEPLPEEGVAPALVASLEAEEPESASISELFDDAAKKFLASVEKLADEKDPFEGFRDSPEMPERIEVKPSAKKSRPPATGSSTVTIIRNPNATTGKKPGRRF